MENPHQLILDIWNTLNNRLRDQSDTSADSYVLDKVSINALNSESISSYRNMFRLYHEKHFWNDLPVEDFLIRIGAAKIAETDGRIHPTLGGLIFFGDFMSITDELPYFFLDYREVLPGAERWSDRVCSGDADWSGNVYDFFFRIAHRITSDVKRPFKLDENMLRIDDSPIHKGIRECLANSLIHADYYGRRGVVIVKELNKITISNPGSFRIDLDEAISGGVSNTRNTKIFNMFALIDVGERAGTGLCNVFNVWKQYGYSEPAITESVEPDRVTMVIHINDTVMNVANSTENVANSKSFSKCDNAVYDYMMKHPSSSVAEIADSIRYTTRSVQRSFIKFENIGLVSKNGNRSNRIRVLESSHGRDS